MLPEPVNPITGVHLFHIHGQPYVLCYICRVRGRKKYGIVFPIIDTRGTWEECITACELHYMQNNKPPKRRAKCARQNPDK